MEIDIYDEDFCIDDLDETNDLIELEEMKTKLTNEVYSFEDKLDLLEENLGIIKTKIQEIKNES